MWLSMNLEDTAHQTLQRGSDSSLTCEGRSSRGCVEWEAAGISGSMPSSADNASKLCQAAGHQVHAGYSEGYREKSIRVSH